MVQIVHMHPQLIENVVDHLTTALFADFGDDSSTVLYFLLVLETRKSPFD